LYRFCVSEGSDSSGVVLDVIVEEAHRSGVALTSSCNGIEPTMDALGLLKRLYDGLDKNVSTVVARLAADEAVVMHELGTALSAREVVRLGVVWVAF
jgi:hypothetical protein